ncbi:glycosyltransferase family 4 protein [Candidatus Peregrinibacteria bacterium]|nr:glycosyltransferase family 4 protein [Candidatus Peregrinibacteria bacterium]
MLCVSFGVRAACLGLVTVWRGGHVHLGDAALAPLGWFLKKMGRGRVTVTACGLDVIWPRRWYQWMLRRTLPAMDRVVCISRATAEEARKRGVAEEKIAVIPPGVWSDVRSVATASLVGAMNSEAASRKRSRRVAPLLLTVGRLVPRKGITWFVREVVPLLLRDFPQLQYWIVGSGPEELLIKKVVQENGLGHCVHLRGELNDAKREECFTQADLFIMPNVVIAGDMEGFGIVCIEASARGVPVVAARLDGLPDAVVDLETGRLFEPGDPEDCARVIREVIKKQWDRTKIARATLEHYGWPNLFQRYRDEVFGF